MTTSALVHSAQPGRASAVTFIEPGMAEIHCRLREARPDAETIVLNGPEPAPVQMARALAGRADVDSVHWITQGDAGAVRFTGHALRMAQFDEFTEAWRQIGGALADQGTLALWRCEAPQGNAARAVIHALAG